MIEFPHESVTLYVLVIVSEQVFPSDTSLTKATVGVPQLSKAFVTTEISEAGISSKHSTLISVGVSAVGSVTSRIIILCSTLIEFPHESVTLYVLVIVSGHELLSETSPTNATVGVPQLSNAFVTTVISAGGTSSIHSKLISTGVSAVGPVISSIIISCVTSIEFPHESVTLYVLVIVSGHELLSEISLTKATVGMPQLSKAFVTTEISKAGISSKHSILIFANGSAVGSVKSSITMF